MFFYQHSLLIPLFVLVIGADGRRRREQNKSIDRFPEICQGRAHLCERSDYRKVMSQLCAKTCSHISEQITSPSTPTNSSCGGKADKIEDCARRTSYCVRSEYRQLMNRYCCHTCTKYLGTRSAFLTTKKPNVSSTIRTEINVGASTDKFEEQNEGTFFKSE
ncbi:hypothetical protein M3Y96_01184900 [Aphelenchoides besseyi]|nr:hypothetical protein M3Y96_01184900 [Aphelenchoides besseyi]